MLKLVAASTLALSALAASIPFSHANADCPEGVKCGMDFAPVADLAEALLETAQASARALALASELARYGEATGSSSALLVAADMFADLNVGPIADSPLALPTDDELLAQARTLAADDAVVLAMIDDRLAEQDRGSVFDVEPFNGQGGESWVNARDSLMFTRSYENDTDAVLTLVAAPDAALEVRVVDAQGGLVCEGKLLDGSHSCVWPADAGGDYAIQVSNLNDASVSFTIWTN
jgi:hypothetical protein